MLGVLLHILLTLGIELMPDRLGDNGFDGGVDGCGGTLLRRQHERGDDNLSLAHQNRHGFATATHRRAILGAPVPGQQAIGNQCAVEGVHLLNAGREGFRLGGGLIHAIVRDHDDLPLTCGADGDGIFVMVRRGQTAFLPCVRHMKIIWARLLGATREERQRTAGQQGEQDREKDPSQPHTCLPCSISLASSIELL